MKRFILLYIILRPFISLFYDVYPVGQLRITDIVGFIFPMVLFLYYISRRGLKERSSVIDFFTALAAWMIFSSIIEFLLYDVELYYVAKPVLRFINGYAAFLVFPMLFKNEKDVKQLITAFIVGTIFPLLQGFSQSFLGTGSYGMSTKESQGVEMNEGLYGNYGVYAITTMIGLTSLIYFIGQKEFLKKLINKFTFLFLFIGYLVIGAGTLSRTLLFNILAILTGYLGSFSFKRKSTFTILFLLLLLFIFFISSDFFQDKMELISKRSESEMQVLEGDRDIQYAFHGRIGRWDYYGNIFFSNYSFLEQLVGTDVIIGPHGDYLYWLFRYGYIGIFLYLLFLVKISQFVYRKFSKTKLHSEKQYGRMCLIALLVWLITGITSTPSLVPDLAYFILGNVAVFINLKRPVLR